MEGIIIDIERLNSGLFILRIFFNYPEALPPGPHGLERFPKLRQDPWDREGLPINHESEGFTAWNDLNYIAVILSDVYTQAAAGGVNVLDDGSCLDIPAANTSPLRDDPDNKVPDYSDVRHPHGLVVLVAQREEWPAELILLPPE